MRSGRSASIQAMKDELDLAIVLHSSSSDSDGFTNASVTSYSQSEHSMTLDRLGHDGNGSCLNHMILTWGVSNGSLCNFTSRCFTAMEDRLQAYLKWPDHAERARISGEFASKGFPGCVGLIDGTLIQLSQRPKDSNKCYYDQKNRYSMNAQVVCNHRRKILYMYTGLPGSVSDLTCLKQSKLWWTSRIPTPYSRMGSTCWETRGTTTMTISFLPLVNGSPTEKGRSSIPVWPKPK